MATRIEAVKINQSVYLEYSNAQRYQIAYLGKTLKSKIIDNEFKDVKISSDFGKIYFNSCGSSTKAHTINLTSSSGDKKIKISPAGKMKIE